MIKTIWCFALLMVGVPVFADEDSIQGRWLMVARECLSGAIPTDEYTDLTKFKNIYTIEKGTWSSAYTFYDGRQDYTHVSTYSMVGDAFLKRMPDGSERRFFMNAKGDKLNALRGGFKRFGGTCPDGDILRIEYVRLRSSEHS